jgi:hypothetical protein
LRTSVCPICWTTQRPARLAEFGSVAHVDATPCRSSRGRATQPHPATASADAVAWTG